jgi:hypothetical protein
LSFLLLLISSLQQNWRREQNRFYLGTRGLEGRDGGAGGRHDPMYAHMNISIKKQIAVLSFRSLKVVNIVILKSVW